ncbi:cyclic-di-AMP phosphodiesterase GdpP [Barrientosiimonas marina]|uniref:Cyclic-di-AMP phosphodiesterase n=1 Tax=Lentibacillus kimchii TaxID=1542911 RepID=A0ABW2UV68_9BACI
MQDVQKRSGLSRHLWATYIVSVILLGFIWYFQWVFGLVLTCVLAAVLYYSIQTEYRRQKETAQYIATLSHRVKRVGEEALLEMPLGILLYNESNHIEWANPYMNQFMDNDTLVGHSLNALADDLASKIQENTNELWLEIDGYHFQVIIRKDERLLYFFDRTVQSKLESRYYDEQTVIGIIFLDNYEEITQSMDDTLKSQLNSKVTGILNSWSNDYGIYLKRISQDRFLGVFSKETLEQLEKVKFSILDEVRELNAEQNLTITLSIGIGDGDNQLPDLGESAQSSLDLALGRGGDQVVIKDDAGKVRFYGGRTNPMEKRTRVRARVISHALRDLVQGSDNVIIMGHKAPDMDAFGAAIGILNIAKASNVEGYVVFDPDDVDTGVHRLVDKLKEDEDLWSHFVDPDESEALITSRSLVVVVDTHKPSMVAHEDLLDMADYKVVIDHHRRAEEFVEDPTLVYMEPYASSTAELVTELLEYQPEKLKLKMLEATALLAGIIVDTKSFTLRTGSRTFDAASYLRSKGADTVLVQRLMKEDLDVYIQRSRLIERSEIYYDTIAIAKGEPGAAYGSVLIAQTADTLLTMSGINASFVITERSDGRIGVSARSLGDVNVQVVMEQMNGGGHLTNAATQLADTTIDETDALLKDILENYFTGGE